MLLLYFPLIFELSVQFGAEILFSSEFENTAVLFPNTTADFQ